MTTNTKYEEGAGGGNEKRKACNLPPDPDGLFKRAASRGNKVIAFYEELYPDPGRDWLVANLLHDLMHFCDRNGAIFGDFATDEANAHYLYDSLLEENLDDLGWEQRRERQAKGSPKQV